ncbi:filamentous hemagglutinin N-terminal domain-containing protein [Salmonella enterica subsp. enterica serovar Saintpaul]|nr:filamentous hemagglutinin N-terminal domain-containing protein [Salmonella enterica subsp. enterica serovar Saintpaul]
MNKIYRLRFDRRRNALVVVSEITTGAGKEKNTGHVARLPGPSSFVRLMGTLTPLALLTGFIISLFPGGVVAADLPIGGQIVGGQGSISTSGNQMTIHQQTQNMATNWHSFDVGKNSIVQFVQPDSSSVALNRVTGASGSQIMGTLKANGQVFILNPSGVLFGKDARVNVGGLVASTKNINTADFMKGQYTLSGEGNPGAQVVNQGSLTTTKGGYIVLAGERVSNSGVTTTPGGKTVLAAGKTVTLKLDNGGLTSVSVNGSVVNALVENQGLISATDGRVFLTAKGQDMLLNTVVNNSGTIEAKGLASRGGEIVLDGGESGVVSQSGQLLADSHTGQGGKVILEGQNIYLAGGSLTSATGQTGGGEVYVGGGWQGKDSRIKNASKVVMDKAVTVDVSATDAGNGGTAVLWSDDYTNFRGSILAQGGAQSGNGGRVETSSHRNLQVSGTADASARAGHGGEWLLDPTDVTITGTGTDTGVRTTGKGSDLKLDTDTEHLFTPTASGAQILNTSIENQLNNGTAVIVKTSGFDVSGQSGNITVNANITKTGGADAALTLEADGNITVNKNITSTVGRLNISLLAAGSDSGRIQVLNSTLNSNGGNITLGQLNPTTVAEDGSSISNPNALTVKVNNSTLNASATTGSAGDILISARNPNVNLSQAKYNNTVRNGAVMLELSGNSVLSGGSVTLNAEQSGGNASQLPWYLNNATVNATGDILFSAKMTGGNGAVSAEIRNTSNLTAGGNITLISERAGGNIAALLLNGSAADAIKLTAGKNITLTGVNQGTASAINVKNTALTAGSNITLTGNSTTGTGLSVTGSKLNASHAAITGTSTGGSTGFSLTNTTLSGALADLTNVTLSSAGSGAGAVNILDSSVVTATNRDTLMKMGIENMTSVDMGGAAIFDDSNETDKKGWTANYSMEGLPNHGWIFSNTSVKAGGDVDLKGVGFTNATVNITQGNLSIDNGGSVLLTGSHVSVVNGSVNLHSANGKIDLSKGNLTAKDNITVTASNGTVTVTGVNATDTANITSEAGNIQLTSDASKLAINAVTLQNVSINASQGNIQIDGKANKTVGVNVMNEGVGVKIVNASLSGKNMSITGYTNGNWGVDAGYHPVGGVSLLGNVGLSVTGKGQISGQYDSSIYGGIQSQVAGISIGVLFGGFVTNVAFNGDFDISGAVTGNPANIYNPDYVIGGVVLSGNTTLNFNNSHSTLSANGAGINSGLTAYISSSSINTGMGFILNKSNLNIDVTADRGAAINSLANAFNYEIDEKSMGYIFSGDGNVSISAHNNSSELAAVYVNLFNNTQLHGSFSLNGINDSGDAVSIPGRINANLSKAAITGVSHGSGSGVVVNSSDTVLFDLDNNTITGTSASGNGIIINGNNVTLTNGTLTGTATSGNGSGVSLTGGSNYTIDGATVTGQSADGTGVSVSGNLTVNNNARLNGAATGNGSGVSVNGTLASEGGVSISGTATIGDGVQVAGNTQLNNATVNGSSTDGSGIHVGGNLTNSNTTLSGSASGQGSGVEVGGNITGGTITGNAASGSGVLVSGEDSTVTDAVLKGSTESGTGVSISGNLTNAGSTTVSGNAGSSGTGVDLSGNVTGGSVTGNSVSGSGISVSGGDSVATNTALNGSSAGGTGVAISGNLTNAGTTTVSGNTEGSGAGVALSGSVTGGAVSGTSASGSGVTINGTVNSTVNGLSKRGSGVQLNDGAEVTGTGQVSGGSESGNGVSVSGHVTNNGAVKGESTSGNGTVISGSLTGNDSATITGSTTGNGNGLYLDGTVAGGRVSGSSVGGDAVHLGDGAQVSDANVSGTSQIGAGIKTDGSVHLKGAHLSGSSGSGADIDVSGTLSHDPDTVINASTVTGREHIKVVEQGRPGAMIAATTQRQGAVNAQVSGMNTAQQGGFHSAGMPAVPVSGYQPAGRTVDISLCDGSDCQSESLDAGRPAQGRAKTSGR